jgi:hypothetical protein
MKTILHLTDVHFGWEGDDPSGQANRKVCLEGMLAVVKRLEPPWKPTVICMTGDVAWRGSRRDYEEAKTWLDELLEACGLTYNELVVCAGNHDVIRPKAEKIPRPDSTRNADQVLSPPIAEHFQGPFADFIDFSKGLGLPALTFGDSESYLVGTRTTNGLRFVVLNSAWFSRDDQDKEKLWIGLPHLRHMEAKAQLPLIEPGQNGLQTVTLLHHPAEWLHPDERHASGSRPNTLDYLARRCHLLLTGHTHGEVRRADRIADGALLFTGGSAYAGASHFNSFRLIRVDSDQVADRAFEFDPRSAENRWRPRPADTRPLANERQCEEHASPAKAEFSTKEFRAAFRADAARHLERKSRLLRQAGPLPAAVSRPVSVRISAQREEYDSERRVLRRKNAEQTMPFYEAVRESRRTLLLGDLGTGKSTLAAQLVIETMDRSERAVAVFVPTKALQCSGQFTQRDLLSKIDAYIANEVWLKTPTFGLHSALERGIEVLIVLDGLDELARDIAARLLNRAAEFVDTWPTIQVVTTARPVELLGVSYADWRIVHTVSLDDAAKGEFIKQELIADGLPTGETHERAAALLRSLKEMPPLDSIANSPLAVRLIYPRLNTIRSSASVTLGDLLYDLLLERLGGWQKRDDKPSSYSEVEQALPTAEQKAEFLACLADRATAGKPVGHDEAKAIFEEKAATLSGANKHLLGEEALSFYEWLGLIRKGATIEFPLQPLAEVCAAVGCLGRWRSNPEMSLPDRAVWRVISFVAAVARRRGLLNEMRRLLTKYIDYLLNDPNYLPAACYVVVEAADAGLAVHAVHGMDNVGYRPLTFFRDDWATSARNVATTLVLANEAGFDWFYKDYLDPRYPIPNAGSAIVGRVFQEWAALVRPTLTSAQKQKLSKMVLPYAATREGHFYGVLTILSVLVPDAFSRDDRVWYHSLALDDTLFASWVKGQFLLAKADGESARSLNAVLSDRASESIQAARLWLDWDPGVEPPYSVIELACLCASKLDTTAEETDILTQCSERLGQDIWMRFVRWALTADQALVAAGAAKVLYDAGERRLSVLGDVAMRAMHDGAYVAAAERFLSALVLHEGDRGVRWLANQVAHSEELFGSHSGWWRVLLGRIETTEDGPALLAACVRNLGPFTLPRHPEVREAFARILNGPKGKSFREALREQLASLDPSARQGAASILVSSDPRNEADALFVATRSRAKPHSLDWHEWDSFCLTLDFGPSVLASLKSKLNRLEPQSRAFALVVLLKGGVELEPGYRAELAKTLSSLGNWHLCIEPAGQAVLRQEPSFDFLLEQLGHPASDLAEQAAERLLEFHRQRLSRQDEAKCLALRHATSSWTWEFAGIMRRVVCEPDFARDLIAASIEIREGGGRTPILGLVAEATVDSAKWKDVVWSLLCDDTRLAGSSESESGGTALLQFGLLSQEHRERVGQAAKGYLDDPRVKQNRWHEAYHWLGLLADEFVGLDKETIRSVILHGRPIGYSATTALIARLGQVPDGFSCERPDRRRQAIVCSEAPDHRNVSKVVQELKDYGRDSDELHPLLLGTLQQCVCLPVLDEPTLGSISSAGRPGILISATLRFIYGMPQHMEETIPLLGRWFKPLSDDRLRSHLGRLTRVWKILRGSAFVDSPASTEAYLTALDGALLNREGWKLAIARDILELRRFLSDSQIPIVFAEYADHPTNMHPALFICLCEWLAGDITEATKRVVVLAADQAIVTLNEQAWFPKGGDYPNTWADLLFPAIQWAHGAGSSPACEAVFLRGVRSIFEEFAAPQGFPRPSLSKLLAELDPLLSKAPPESLGKAVRRGIKSLEPSVSAFCRLIDGFSKHASGHR